ncbi:unnamed protein product [Sympodiomycopsis kandeliae]
MKVAIIGGGVSGLSALWGLNEFSDHEAHLFESGEYIGGHTNTVRYEPTPAVKDQGKEGVDVDTGFIVFNTVTYPNFLRFINYIGVEILKSDMSFAVTRSGSVRNPFFSLPFSSDKTQGPSSVQRGSFEWAGTSPNALFCQFTNLFNPTHWRMVWDIIRFNNQSIDTLRQQSASDQTIGEWLDERGYGVGFRRNYLIPMTASIWSTPPSIAFNSFPAITLLRFMHNHHLLQILDRPQWLTLKGGSRNYVRKILNKVDNTRIHHGKQGQGKVVSVKKQDGGWAVTTQDGQSHTFDQVVFACHADTALSILDEYLTQDDQRRRLLGKFQFSKNEAVLHADERLLPVARSAWAAWNFIAEECPPSTAAKGPNGGIASAQDADRVSLTYWMNLLQSLPENKHGPVLVTLNPPTGPAAPREELVAARYSYDHPVYTSESVESQRALKPLQGKDGLHFTGAWLNYGFHEDGFKSGLEAAQLLGSRLPFEILPAERDLPKRDWSLTLINSLESTRKWIAPLLLWTAYPLVIASTCWFELLSNVVAGKKSAISQALRRVRVDWEDTMRTDGNGRQGGIWAQERKSR